MISGNKSWTISSEDLKIGSGAERIPQAPLTVHNVTGTVDSEQVCWYSKNSYSIFAPDTKDVL